MNFGAATRSCRSNWVQSPQKSDSPEPCVLLVFFWLSASGLLRLPMLTASIVKIGIELFASFLVFVFRVVFRGASSFRVERRLARRNFQ
jgi:hypothetical protein